jgi:hypothetical protein
MAGKLKPLDVERKIWPGKFCASWQRSGANLCPRPDWLRGMGGHGMATSVKPSVMGFRQLRMSTSVRWARETRARRVPN